MSNFDNINRRVGDWIKGRNRSGHNGLILVRDAIRHITGQGNGDWTPLAKLAGHPEASTQNNVKRIVAAFGMQIKADKKQPSGCRIVNANLLDPVSVNYVNTMAKLDAAIDAKLSLAGRALAGADYFRTDKEAEKEAEKAAKEAKAEAEAVAEAEADADAEPEIGEIVAVDLLKFEQAFAALNYADQAVLLAKLQEIHTRNAPIMIAAA